jgi:hypothetical protein
MSRRPRGDRKPQRFKQTEAARLVRAARDAGLAITEIKLRPDGSLGFVVGAAGCEPTPEPPRNTDTELAEFEAKHRGKT